MKNYDYVLFDLDGTITDSAAGIINSVIYALGKYGITVSDRSELNKFLGPPLEESFEIYFGFSKTEVKNVVKYYREYYRDKGIFENLVYEGFEDLLKSLKANNKTLIVATSKPEAFARQILDHFDISKYFMYIAGSNFDGSRTKKDEIIEYAMKACNISDMSRVIMVGDREHDIIGAKKVGVDSIGALYGYASGTELEDAGATYIAKTVPDIGKIIFAE